MTRFGISRGDFDVLATLCRSGEPCSLSPSTLTPTAREPPDEAVTAGLETQRQLLARFPAANRHALDRMLRELLMAVSEP